MPSSLSSLLPRFARRALVGSFAVALLASGCSTGDPAPLTIEVVHGEDVVSVEVPHDATVGDALDAAGVAPTDGVLRGVVSGDDLGPNGDDGQVVYRGLAVASDRQLGGSGSIEVVDGEDSVEGTEVVTRPVAPEGLPKAIQYVQFPGVPGSGEATIGEVSGEEVSVTTTTDAIPAHRATGPVLALTFDDGPSPTYTPEVLTILAEQGVPATFCQIGSAATEHPELTAQVLHAGHQLCNHTQNHVERLEDEPRATVSSEMTGGRDSIAAAGDGPPPYYRPPGGSLGPVIYEVADELDESVLYWSIDPRDWKRPPPEEIVGRVVSHLEPGGVILLHDGGGNRESTVAALPAIIEFARALGYTFTLPLSDDPAVG